MIDTDRREEEKKELHLQASSAQHILSNNNLCYNYSGIYFVGPNICSFHSRNARTVYFTKEQNVAKLNGGCDDRLPIIIWWLDRQLNHERSDMQLGTNI